jgi:hypothetical protein
MPAHELAPALAYRVVMAAFNAYIDEAGDEGFVTLTLPGQGSSEWLVLGAVIVRDEDDLALSHAVDDLRVLLNKPPPKPLHFRKLRHNAKRAAMDRLATYDFVFSIVALWKPPQGRDGRSPRLHTCTTGLVVY